MPTYQYACTACGHRLEAVQSFTDDPLTECPECAGRLRKQYGSVGVVFKGSGFYRTDSRNAANGGKKEGAKSESTPAAAGASSSSGSSSSGSSSAESSGSSGSPASGSSSGSGGSGSGGSAAKSSAAAPTAS